MDNKLFQNTINAYEKENELVPEKVILELDAMESEIKNESI